MEHLAKIRTMPSQTPPPLFDWGTLSIVFTICGFVLTGYWKWVTEKFKSDKEQKKAFIEEIVDATVKKTLDAILGDIRDDIRTLFKYREDDRKHYDTKFDNVIREIKK